MRASHQRRSRATVSVGTTLSSSADPRSANCPEARIFTINPKGEVSQYANNAFLKTCARFRDTWDLRRIDLLSLEQSSKVEAQCSTGI